MAKVTETVEAATGADVQDDLTQDGAPIALAEGGDDAANSVVSAQELQSETAEISPFDADAQKKFIEASVGEAVQRAVEVATEEIVKRLAPMMTGVGVAPAPAPASTPSAGDDQAAKRKAEKKAADDAEKQRLKALAAHGEAVDARRDLRASWANAAAPARADLAGGFHLYIGNGDTLDTVFMVSRPAADLMFEDGASRAVLMGKPMALSGDGHPFAASEVWLIAGDKVTRCEIPGGLSYGDGRSAEIPSGALAFRFVAEMAA